MSHHHFSDAERLYSRLEPADRDHWQMPAEVIAALSLPANARVADLGAGTGYFSVRLAEQVPQGKVLALDASPAMVEYVAQRAQVLGLEHLSAQLIGAGGEGDFGPVDLVLTVDAYHHITNRVAYFTWVASKLTATGRLVVIDRFYCDEDVAAGKTRVKECDLEAELVLAGFRLTQRFDFLPRQYFLIFERNSVQVA